MSSNFCLLPSKILDFRKALKEKEIKISELLNMTSEARTNLLREYAGDNAPQVNLLFEEKLVLKNRMLGLKNWASKVGEIGKYSPEGKAKLERLKSEYRAAQQERIFSPKENEAFLNDLANKKIGTEITEIEAETIFELTEKINTLKKEFNPTTEVWSSEKTRMELAGTKAILAKYVDDLKTGNLSVKEMITQYGKEVKVAWGENKPKTVVKVLLDSADQISRTLINGVASWDNSFLGRQGGITLIKSPKIWWNMAKESFKDFKKSLGGEEMQVYALREELMSRPNGMNGNYETAKLFPRSEEEVPTRILERVPVIGRIFKASDTAFLNSAMRARADLFDMMLEAHKKTGMDATEVLIKDLGTVVNAITARGKLGQFGGSKPVQLLMWAPRMLKADWDVLTAHTFGAGLETNFARKQAAKTIFGLIVATAGILTIAEALGADVEKDPRSTDFLSIKVGNTRIKAPFTRGMTQIVTLMARLLTQQTKSTSTGIITKLNSGEYGSRTLFDVGMDFLVNKTTPPTGSVITWLRGADFKGDKPTIGSTAFGFIPISVQNFIGLKDEATAASVIGVFLDLFGFSVNTYDPLERDWSQNPGVELKQFQDKIGKEKFEEANKKYNQRVKERLNSLLRDSNYSGKSEDDKQKEITKIRNEEKSKIFKEYNFKYKR